MLLLLLFSPLRGGAEGTPAYPAQFSKLYAFEDLPSDEVTQVIQDNHGYLWIATNAGLCRFDGYRIRTYKDNLFMPNLLRSNAIKCLVEDLSHTLWIGTDNGLDRLDLVTGEFRPVPDERLARKPVSMLYATLDSSVWISTSDTLYRYLPHAGEFRAYPPRQGERSVRAVKAMLADSNGNLWAGTWDDGLLRYDAATDRFLPCPLFGGTRSIHVLFEDSRGTCWAGTWGHGLFRFEGTPAGSPFRQYRHETDERSSLSDDIVYAIEEDPENGTLWVGTRSGLSILRLDAYENSTPFVNYLPDDEARRLPYNELNAIMRDRSGLFWLGMMGGGVYSADMRHSEFRAHNLEAIRQEVFTASVRSLLVDRDSNLWIGIGSYGLLMQPRGTTKPLFYKEPDGEGTVDQHTVNCFIERDRSGEVWMGTWGDGIFRYDKQAGALLALSPESSKHFPDPYVFSLMEDGHHNVWVGTRSGVALLYPDGSGCNLTERMQGDDGQPVSLAHTCYEILETRDRHVWIATSHGIFRLTGSAEEPSSLRVRIYDNRNGRLAFNEAQCLHEDSRGRLWAGLEAGGLTLYDPEKDRFLPMNTTYGLLADAVLSIQEDKRGNLWLGTNMGLVHLTVGENTGTAASYIYTKADGLLDNIFIRKASGRYTDGTLFFGGHNGYISFHPDRLSEVEKQAAVSITDISVFNIPLDRMPAAVRQTVSPAAPDYAERITLSHAQNNFSIEFSSLTYVNPSKNKYAYRLEGFDEDWRYTGASNRVANYNNLPAGHYTFCLKGSNENGLWSDAERRLAVTVLPPPWRTPWAYLLYFATGALLLGFAYRLTRDRIREKQERQLDALERAKAEEVNHAKLQFFTNITHEFLTPLTILSASLDELKLQAPQQGSYYRIMSDNINRLIRLIQQILEFRKAETGNLQLRVSQGDISSFIRKEVDAFTPLMKRKRIRCLLTLPDTPVIGYFDTDKLDKILYNLLSNASKYNREEGTIEVTVTQDTLKGLLTLTVKDEGEGIPPEAQKRLFQRFYEGDYRRFKTIGTGIGLSLTKDLVILHGGTIRVESEKGKGTAFFVTLPITRSAFRDDQVDASLPAEPETAIALPETGEETLPELPPAEPATTEPRTLLLVEDNEELLSLMEKLLRREFRLFTATNGQAALEVLGKEEIDLVVSDVMMPVMDGITLCRTIKGQIDTSHIPILLLTAKNSEEDRIEAYESGADAFLSKPFNRALLHARIRNLLRSRERNAREFKKQLVFEAQELDYTSIDEEFLERAIACVNRHLADADFDQPQFIEEMATSKSTLYKKLKSLTGLNCSAFIRNIRLKAACRIIDEKKHLRISELAYAVGFNDPKYFSSCFKKEFGLLPTEYMERFGE